MLSDLYKTKQFAMFRSTFQPVMSRTRNGSISFKHIPSGNIYRDVDTLEIGGRIRSTRGGGDYLKKKQLKYEELIIEVNKLKEIIDKRTLKLNRYLKADNSVKSNDDATGENSFIDESGNRVSLTAASEKLVNQSIVLAEFEHRSILNDDELEQRSHDYKATSLPVNRWFGSTKGNTNCKVCHKPKKKCTAAIFVTPDAKRQRKADADAWEADAKERLLHARRTEAKRVKQEAAMVSSLGYLKQTQKIEEDMIKIRDEAASLHHYIQVQRGF